MTIIFLVLNAAATSSTAMDISVIHSTACHSDDKVIFLTLHFFLELLESDDDELLYTLAEELSVLCDYIDPPHLHLLIPPLETLAAQEETVVRERVRVCLPTTVHTQRNTQQSENDWINVSKRK